MSDLVHKLEKENDSTHDALKAAHALRSEVSAEALVLRRQVEQLTQDLEDEQCLNGKNTISVYIALLK